MFYLDTLRVVLTILVVLHHIGQAYGPTGGAWPVQEATRAAVLSPFFTVNRSFFMSLFFMISGFLAVGALERHGFRRFVRSRLVRLGIPVLVFGLIGMVVRFFFLNEQVSNWTRLFNAGHLWYLEHVLLFSVVYAAWRLLRNRARSTAQAKPERPVPGLPVTLAALLVVAVLCGLVRIWSPIDRWTNVLGFIATAFADVPRDLAFFIFGVLAARRGWFERYPTRRGMGWLGVGLAAAAAMYAWRLVPHGGLALSDKAFGLVYLAWEELVAFGFCIGLLVAFRQFANRQGRLAGMLAANQYSVYFWHVGIVVVIQVAVRALSIPPLAKFGLVSLVAVPLVFLWSALMRKIPAVRAVL